MRVRFTLGRMMIAVAVTGVLLGLLVYARELRNRSAAYGRLATEHTPSPFEAYYIFNGMNNKNYIEFKSALRAHHERLRIKYERAARYPWLPVEPDPPEPAWPRQPAGAGRSPFDLFVGEGEVTP